MMFIVRNHGETPSGADFTLKLARRTPALASGGTHDFFCEGDPETARARGLTVVLVHDGWYADDTGGGVAVWGQGKFWELRDTPFTIRESSAGGSTVAADAVAEGEVVNVRQAIFGV